MAVLGIAFAVGGGEYSTLDWWQLRTSVERETATIERLRREIDSLTDWAELLETDPVTQERVAREDFGMLRPGEKIFRVEER